MDCASFDLRRDDKLMNCLRAVDECFLLYIDFCQIPASERLNWGQIRPN